MGDKTPVFSIIIPVYNTINELRRCTDSILGQSFQDFELVLVDDGSTDGSAQLCDQLASEDKRVVSLHKENGGCADARNYGTRHAKGQYLIYVDSDDKWQGTQALSDLGKIIDKNPGIDIICFGVRIIDDTGKIVKVRNVEEVRDEGLDKAAVLKPLIYTNQYFCTSYVKCLRKEFVIDNDLYFIKGILSEDIEWSARLIVLCKRITTYSKVFYDRINRTEGSITSSIGKKNILDILASIETGVQFTKEYSENKELLDIYYEYWAYQYAMLYCLLSKIRKDPDYNSIIKRIGALKWLLKYDHVKKVKMIHMAAAVFGVKGAAALAGIYYGVSY